jgi:hypothetical protein
MLEGVPPLSTIDSVPASFYFPSPAAYFRRPAIAPDPIFGSPFATFVSMINPNESIFRAMVNHRSGSSFHVALRDSSSADYVVARRDLYPVFRAGLPTSIDIV